MRGAQERLLLRLEWRVVRRLEGRVLGGYRTARRGSGFDLAGLRGYIEGDDARRIDWTATARLGDPVIRVYNEDRELTVWLVLDCSASMAVSTPGRGKHDVLAELTLLLGLLFARGGNRVGALLYDIPSGNRPGSVRHGGTSQSARRSARTEERRRSDEGAPTALKRAAASAGNTVRTRVVPPGSGRRHVLRIGAELERAAADRRDGAMPGRAGHGRAAARAQRRPRGAGGVTTDLAAMLETVARLARRRSLIVVISDLIGEGDWERPLTRLARRHEVVALRVTDAADDGLPDAGLIVIEDAETGEQLIIDSGDPLLRARLAAGVSAREASLVAGMRQARVPLHRISTDSDLGRALVQVVAETQRRPG